MNEAPTTLYVRGKYQIARYEPGSAATGHRLTEHEVREAYGSDVLTEVAERMSAVLLARDGVIEQALQKQREELGVTQRQLASAADKSLKTVERAEQDADQLELREIEHLAFVLGLDPAKLSIDERAGADPANSVLGCECLRQRAKHPWRGLASPREPCCVSRKQHRLSGRNSNSNAG